MVLTHFDCLLVITLDVRVVSKMVSWFPTVTEEDILAFFETAGPSNTKKTTKFGFAVFTSTVLVF